MTSIVVKQAREAGEAQARRGLYPSRAAAAEAGIPASCYFHYLRGWKPAASMDLLCGYENGRAQAV